MDGKWIIVIAANLVLRLAGIWIALPTFVGTT
jgi:hypothetical protein